jgi:molybdopterin-guanine dinucleotide biosynthesis protein A
LQDLGTTLIIQAERYMENILFNSALILAGGRGRRIGYDKKELVINGEKVIDNLIGELQNIFNNIIVSSNTVFERDNVVTIKDEIGEGPLAGIYSALKTMESGYLYVIACDMPFISPSDITNKKDIILKDIADGSAVDALVTEREDGFLEPFNAFYHINCAQKIYEQLVKKEYKIAPLLNRLNLCKIKKYNKDLFFNINNKEDLEAASIKKQV